MRYHTPPAHLVTPSYTSPKASMLSCSQSHHELISLLLTALT